MRCALSITLPDGELPTEFRIFVRGKNPTSKGVFTFDDASAASVLEAQRVEGTDVMIDLNHETLSPALRSDSHDARGWCNLEVREDGSLWAVNVRWTPDGAARLANKTQRYVSPVFMHDKAGHVERVVNVALVAMPATHDAPALVAASRAALDAIDPAATVCNTMDPAKLKAAIDALKNEDGKAALALLEEMLVGNAAEESGEPPEDPSAAPDPATAEAADPVVAAKLTRTLGVETVAEAFTELGVLLAERAALAADRAALESTERVDLIASLVKLGAELPALAWADPAKRVPSTRLAAESLSSLRERVAAHRGARKPIVTPPVTGDGEAVASLTPSELAACKRAGVSPADYVARKATAATRIG